MESNFAGGAVPVSKKKRIEDVKLALQEQLAKDSPDENSDEVPDVSVKMIFKFSL